MRLIFALIFTVICKPGMIYEADDTITEMAGDKYEYYYFELDYPDGTYLYVSTLKDSCFFIVSDKEVLYEWYNHSKEEFDIQNK